MSIITTGINIVANVGGAIADVHRFGRELQNMQRQSRTMANGLNRDNLRLQRSSSSLSQALNRDWRQGYEAARRSTRDQERELRRLNSSYERTFREIGNKYQSMVMGSVALSMSGIGLKNTGTVLLGGMKETLDAARDFETVISQISFYGKSEWEKMGLTASEEIKKIEKQIFQMGYDLPVRTSEVANSVLAAQKLGYSNPEQAMKMANEASKIQFMGLGKIDGEESMKYISAVAKLVGKDVVGKDLEHVGDLTDKLAMTADVSAASIDSLWKTIQSSRSSFDALNGDIDTFLTLTGVMSDRLMPRQAGMALSSFSGGVQMAEKAGRENRGTRGKYYNELTAAMGGNYDDFVADPDGKGGILGYIQAVSDKSKEIWGEGTERVGNLQSMFGKSAVDLFYAVESYNEATGRSMLEMKDSIGDADGHAQKLIDTLMNGSYGTEQRLQAVAEQFQILFGSAIRPLFNDILDGITLVIGKINQFMQAHPVLTKVIGYVAGMAGAFLVAAGSVMILVGGLLALYASLGNIVVQIVRNTRMMNMLSQGYATAGALVAGKLLGPLKLLGKQLLKMSAITFFVWMAWKNDFMRMRTTFNDWKNYVSKGLSQSASMFEVYSQSSADSWNIAWNQANQNGSMDNFVARNLTKAKILWAALKEGFKKHTTYDAWDTEKKYPNTVTGVLSDDTHEKLDNMGLLGVVEGILEARDAVAQFWAGFSVGLNDGMSLLKTFLGPLIDVWDFLSEKVLSLFQHFGYFENVNKGIGTQWEQWGAKLGYIVGAAVAIRVAIWGWVKAIKLALKPVSLLIDLFKKLKNFKMSMVGRAMGGMARGAGRLLMGSTFGTARRARDTVQKQTKGHNRTGAQSRIPYARQNIDPTTGQPKTKRKGNVDVADVSYQRKWWQRNKKGPTVVPSGDPNVSRTVRARGIRGRMKDTWKGRQYIPDERTDSRGRKYNHITTRNGESSRTSPDGRAGGKEFRTGGVKGAVKRPKKFLAAINRVNFADAGMDYRDSKSRRGHMYRSVKAGAKGYLHRQRNLGFQAGGGFSSRVQSELNGGKDKGRSKAQGRIIGLSSNVPDTASRTKDGAKPRGKIAGYSSTVPEPTNRTKDSTKPKGKIVGYSSTVPTQLNNGKDSTKPKSKLARYSSSVPEQVSTKAKDNAKPKGKLASYSSPMPEQVSNKAKVKGKLAGYSSPVPDQVSTGTGQNKGKAKGKGIGSKIVGLSSYVPEQVANERNERKGKKGGVKSNGIDRTSDDRPSDKAKSGGKEGKAGGKAGKAGKAGKGLSAANLFKGAGKGIGKVAGTLGKGLVKGLGGVITKGIPMIFKAALGAFSFVGWALLAWQAISMIWSNWDSIKNAAGVAWDWIKEKASLLWDGVKEKAGAMWDWVKEKASAMWQGVVSFAQAAWEWIKGIASGVWQGILGFATAVWNGIVAIASGVWNAILGFASAVWNGIVAIATAVWNGISAVASAVWNAILGFATNVWNGITTIATTVWNGITTVASGVWESIKGFASSMWEAMKGFASTAWSSVTGIASTVIETIKGMVNGIFGGLYSAAVSAWNNVKAFITGNPITQTVVTKSVTQQVGGKTARTGEWYVPRDNMPYTLHQGEMVLKRNEAQVLRGLVGSDNNSVVQSLLDRNDDGGGNLNVTAPQKKIIRPSIKVADPANQTAPQGKGETSIQVTFNPGAIQVANATPAEMKKGAKTMFEEFKRMVEIENMQHYKPARTRTR